MGPVGIVLHGGASESWVGDAASFEATNAFLDTLVSKAEASLRQGATAVDVAAEVVAELEDFPEFNAGKGSAVNMDGGFELEAGIVNGADSAYRAAVCLRTTKNPVRLARAMLDRRGPTAPVLMAGVGGDQLARRLGLETVDNGYFGTERRLSYWRQKRPDASEHGTVGAVVLDARGNVAAANSTGGMTMKPVGRVGDTAILGSGLYADERVAVACSGGGEAIMTSMLAGRIANLYRGGAGIARAVEQAVWEATRRCPSISCGVIAITSDGEQTAQCNSRIFNTASAGDAARCERHVGLLRCTMPVIGPLCCYDDDLLRIGVSKHPTRPGQLTFQLKGASLADMDREQVFALFGTLRRAAKALVELVGSPVSDVAMMTWPGGDGGHLFPVHIRRDSEGEDGGEDGKDSAERHTAMFHETSMVIRRAGVGDGACRQSGRRGLLLVGEAEAQGAVGALWGALQGGLREALQLEGPRSPCSGPRSPSARSWSLLVDPAAAGRGEVLVASSFPDHHWPSPAPFASGTHDAEFTAALGPRSWDLDGLRCVADGLREKLGGPAGVQSGSM
ncbi:Isoaspartyl peptidase/L-asparaginase 1 [Metarhizium brunneum]|uniref:Isoaspartyl peptidase/L-asparaginase 1 n=1 Tax=Metarhizium brunneum TaxID=500148 RepID=A0A7D5V4S0_9HYPO